MSGFTKRVNAVVRGKDKAERVMFGNLAKGDTVFIDGEPRIVVEDAHYSGDASYDGWLLYFAENIDAKPDKWETAFPEDLDMVD